LIWIASFALFALAARLFWAAAFRGNPRLPGTVLAYHHVEGKRGFPATRISRSQFEAQMISLKERGWRGAPLDGLFSPADPEERPIFITFDDSYDSVAGNALPFLKSIGYTATLFIISDFVGRTASWDVAFGNDTVHMPEERIRAALNNGFSIGSHTRTHPDLTALSDARLEDELLNSRTALEDRFGVPVRYLAYPFGRYNRRVKEAVRACGYKGALTISRPLFQRAFDPFAVPATGVYSVDSRTAFLIKAERNGFVWAQDVKDKIINRFAGGSALVKGSRPS
jgi:peptidoglycan/xylan/chitin deacetylase (PgdA/CDA1 family)